MVEGTPSSHGGGTPSSHGEGYCRNPPTIQTWLGGYLGYLPLTIQTWPGRYPRYPHHSDLARGTQGTPTIQTWLGYLPPPSRPCWSISPPSRPGWGTPTIKTWPGYHPTIQTWLGYPPPSRPGWGIPSHPDLAGVPPIEVWTDKQTENSTFNHPSDAGSNKK